MLHALVRGKVRGAEASSPAGRGRWAPTRRGRSLFFFFSLECLGQQCTNAMRNSELDKTVVSTENFLGRHRIVLSFEVFVSICKDC